MEKLSLVGDWTFLYEGAKASVSVQTKNSGCTFEVPYGVDGKLVIELQSYDKRAEKISGTYTIKGESDTIEFKVQEAGKKLTGQPLGFNGRRNWILSR